MNVLTPCSRPGCPGHAEDGRCTTCGAVQRVRRRESGDGPVEAAAAPNPDTRPALPVGRSRVGATPPPEDDVMVTTGGSVVTGLSSVPTHARGKGRLWSDLVWIPTVPYQEPKVMTDPQVPENERRCGGCGGEVGRSGPAAPAAVEGVCTACGTPFSFAPTLRPGDLVAGQYQVRGCLTRGGLGWLYLAYDRNLDDRPVVLKGLLNTGDQDAQEAAIAERRFLIELEHPGIVRILNFVRHPHPATGERLGYIVMEYVGGLSLDKAPANRADPDIRPGILPLDQAIAYTIEALDILADMHQRKLLYCDFKEKNVMQVGDQLKLIDLGATCGFEPGVGALVWGTKGYEAPEIEVYGPSVASDLYTFARTLARLTLDCEAMRNPRQFSAAYRDRLPTPAEAPLLAEVDAYHRLLQRATDPDPARRFGSAAEMAAQLRGVLREVVAAADGTPHPFTSTLFTPELRVIGIEPGDIVQVVPHRRASGHARAARSQPRPAAAAIWYGPQPGQPAGPWSGTARLVPSAAAAALPLPRMDLSDPSASYLATLAATEPRQLVAVLAAEPSPSLELRLRLVRARIDAGDFGGAEADLDALADGGLRDWRVEWYRALSALADGDAAAAGRWFDAAYTTLPGEAAPKLAVAVCAECTGDPQTAARLYEVVWRTNHAHVSAAFGLARTRVAVGDRDGAVAVLESVPHTSSHHLAAGEAAVRCRVEGRDPAGPLGGHLREAAARLDEMVLDDDRRDRLRAEVLETALAWVQAGRAGEAASDGTPILGCAPQERALRVGLERVYRAMARRSVDPAARVALVDRANAVRPWRWF